MDLGLLDLHESLLLGCDGGTLQGGSLFFEHYVFLKIVAWSLLSTCEGLLLSYFSGLIFICSTGTPLYV